MAETHHGHFKFKSKQNATLRLKLKQSVQLNNLFSCSRNPSLRVSLPSVLNENILAIRLDNASVPLHKSFQRCTARSSFTLTLHFS